MKKLLPLLIAVLVVPCAGMAATVVTTWSFNTSGNTEGWQDSFGRLSNFGIAAATGEPTVSVLTGDGTNSSDPITRVFTIAAPTDIDYWSSVSFRFRQLEWDGSVFNPKTYDPTGTIVFLQESDPAGNINHQYSNSIPATSSGAYTVVTGADQWRTVTVDLTAANSGHAVPDYYKKNLNQLRIDLLGGSPGSDLTGQKFELDWVTLSAETIPEPSSALLLLGGVGMLALRRRAVARR